MAPVVITLVSDGTRCLLARQSSFPKGMYSALAGFCDIGKEFRACTCDSGGHESLSTIVLCLIVTVWSLKPILPCHAKNTAFWHYIFPIFDKQTFKHNSIVKRTIQWKFSPIRFYYFLHLIYHVLIYPFLHPSIHLTFWCRLQKLVRFSLNISACIIVTRT